MRIATGDLESDGLLDTATRVWCGCFKEQDGTIHKFRPHQIPEMLAYMDTCDVLKFHNGIGYDFPLLEKLYGYVYHGKKVDTLIMSRLLNPKRTLPYNCPDKTITPHSVAAWGYRVGRGKPDHDDWSEFSEAMLHRCSEDVEIQELIYTTLIEESKSGNWRNAFLLTFELFTNLQLQEEYGWLVDRKHMERCIKVLDRYIRLIDRQIVPHLPNILEIEETKKEGVLNYVRKPFLKSGEYSESVINWGSRNSLSLIDKQVVGPFSRLTFRKVDLNSGQETKDYLLSVGWEPAAWNLDSDGNRSSPKMSKDDPFEGVEGVVGTLAARRVQAKQRKSIIEGLINLIREDGRISCRVTNLATTGRMIHSGIVNIPRVSSFFGKQIRSSFVCGQGKILVGTDSDANQIRNLVSRMNDPEYQEVVLNGKKELGTDIHSVNMRAAGLLDRDQAKTFFYAFLFGAGDAKIGKIVKGTSADGKRLKEQFLKGLPALGKLVETLNKEWRKTAKQKYNPEYKRMEYYDGIVIGLDGRPLTVPSEHQILVYLLQSDEAILMSKAYNIFHEKMKSDGYIYGKDFGVVCVYHDEIDVECNIEIADIVAKHSEDAIREAGEFYKMNCPHKGNAQKGTNWGKIH